MTETEWSRPSRRAASSDPTRPQPMMTTCTAFPSRRARAAGHLGTGPAGTQQPDLFGPMHTESRYRSSSLRSVLVAAEPEAPQSEPSRYRSPGYRAKRAVLGPPLATSQASEEHIRKRVALAVFSSDPISSTAYATEEMLLVLVLAGAAATQLALPISLAIVGLLAILILSYRQIIATYS